MRLNSLVGLMVDGSNFIKRCLKKGGHSNMKVLSLSLNIMASWSGSPSSGAPLQDSGLLA